MQLFYTPNIAENITTQRLSKEEGHHLLRVLRKKVGDVLYLTDGRGRLFKAAVEVLSLKNSVVRIIDVEVQPKRRYHLHMAVAPTKTNDRFEWFLEKATEIGVDEITPLLCGRSERKVIKRERYEKVLVAAMKQSLQTYLPKLNPMMPIDDFLKVPHAGQKFIAHCEEEERASLIKELVTQNNYTILIGPEGDFSHEEISKATEKDFVPVTLGDHRLRTETAAIVACTMVAASNTTISD